MNRFCIVSEDPAVFPSNFKISLCRNSWPASLKYLMQIQVSCLLLLFLEIFCYLVQPITQFLKLIQQLFLLFVSSTQKQLKTVAINTLWFPHKSYLQAYRSGLLLLRRASAEIVLVAVTSDSMCSIPQDDATVTYFLACWMLVALTLLDSWVRKYK